MAIFPPDFSLMISCAFVQPSPTGSVMEFSNATWRTTSASAFCRNQLLLRSSPCPQLLLLFPFLSAPAAAAVVSSAPAAAGCKSCCCHCSCQCRGHNLSQFHNVFPPFLAFAAVRLFFAPSAPAAWAAAYFGFMCKALQGLHVPFSLRDPSRPAVFISR